jgi:hypothetical protein
MTEAPLQPQSPLQRQIAQLAMELAAKLEAKAAQAKHGQVLADCETLLLDDGRQLLRDCLTATLQQQVQDGQKKGAPTAPVLADRGAGTRGLEAGKC